jgi:alpha-N-arabinofuranosidase
VLLQEPLGTISPNIYGQFTEHLGGVIYDGVWVGEDSKIPNVRGIRKALVEALRKIKTPVIRWPGGCFADSYDWKDGVGPRAKRPRRTNFWESDPEAARAGENGPSIFEPNTFGTSEFVDFCRQSGAQPYLAANLRSLPALDFDHWIEYCNSPAGSTRLADLRASDGSRDPFNVRFWGVGNESWGCGGNFTPEDYADEFRRYSTWLPSYGQKLQLIASGANDNDLDWTHRFFERQMGSTHPHHDSQFVGWSLHHYAWNLGYGKTHDWVKGKGSAIDFNLSDWYEIFREGYFMEQIITDQWAAMGQYDTNHSIRLVVDEYGPWYRPGSELTPSHFYEQQITLRDALFTAFTLDIFNRHPEKVMLAACAQLVNCLNSPFLASENKFILTPVYHVFDMYSAHQGGEAVRAEFSSPQASYTRFGQPATFWGLNGSASRQGNTLTLTVVNADAEKPRETAIVLRGATAQSVAVRSLTNSDLHAHNTFAEPNAVRPTTSTTAAQGNTVAFTFPPASVTTLTVQLG